MRPPAAGVAQTLGWPKNHVTARMEILELNERGDNVRDVLNCCSILTTTPGLPGAEA
jgi:hypothetical protein